MSELESGFPLEFPEPYTEPLRAPIPLHALIADSDSIRMRGGENPLSLEFDGPQMIEPGTADGYFSARMSLATDTIWANWQKMFSQFGADSGPYRRVSRKEYEDLMGPLVTHYPWHPNMIVAEMENIRKSARIDAWYNAIKEQRSWLSEGATGLLALLYEGIGHPATVGSIVGYAVGFAGAAYLGSIAVASGVITKFGQAFSVAAGLAGDVAGSLVAQAAINAAEGRETGVDEVALFVAVPPLAHVTGAKFAAWRQALREQRAAAETMSKGEAVAALLDIETDAGLSFNDIKEVGAILDAEGAIRPPSMQTIESAKPSVNLGDKTSQLLEPKLYTEVAIAIGDKAKKHFGVFVNYKNGKNIKIMFADPVAKALFLIGQKEDKGIAEALGRLLAQNGLIGDDVGDIAGVIFDAGKTFYKETLAGLDDAVLTNNLSGVSHLKYRHKEAGLGAIRNALDDAELRYKNMPDNIAPHDRLGFTTESDAGLTLKQFDTDVEEAIEDASKKIEQIASKMADENKTAVLAERDEALKAVQDYFNLAMECIFGE